LDSILLSAMQRRASDIHIEAADRATKVKLRVDGILVPAMEPLDIRLHAPLVSRLKVMSDLDIAERRVPQDGSFRMRLERKTVDLDRKSTRLNSSHVAISYAVFCLKKKNYIQLRIR